MCHVDSHQSGGAPFAGGVRPRTLRFRCAGRGRRGARTRALRVVHTPRSRAGGARTCLIRQAPPSSHLPYMAGARAARVAVPTPTLGAPPRRLRRLLRRTRDEIRRGRELGPSGEEAGAEARCGIHSGGARRGAGGGGRARLGGGGAPNARARARHGGGDEASRGGGGVAAAAAWRPRREDACLEAGAISRRSRRGSRADLGVDLGPIPAPISAQISRRWRRRSSAPPSTRRNSTSSSTFPPSVRRRRTSACGRAARSSDADTVGIRNDQNPTLAPAANLR